MAEPMPQHDDDAGAVKNGTLAGRLLTRIPGRWTGFFGSLQRPFAEPPETAADRAEDGSGDPSVIFSACSRCPLTIGCDVGGCPPEPAGRHEPTMTELLNLGGGLPRVDSARAAVVPPGAGSSGSAPESCQRCPHDGHLDDPAAFVLCWTPDGSLDGTGSDTGGTGQALRIAAAYDVPVFNLQRPDHRARVEQLTEEG